MPDHIVEGMEISGCVLSVDHAGDHEERPLFLVFALRKRFGNDNASTRIMAAVQPDFRTLGSKADQPASV